MELCNIKICSQSFTKDYKVLGYMNFKGSRFLEINEGKTNKIMKIFSKYIL